jgi:hypothetical protein
MANLAGKIQRTVAQLYSLRKRRWSILIKTSFFCGFVIAFDALKNNFSYQ